MIRAAFAAGFAFAIGIGSIPTANAGLLDFLFGWRERKDIQRPAATQAHPEVTISARPKAKGDPTRVKQASKRKSAPAKPAVPPKPQLTPMEQLARTIDPNRNPRWYLEDPTLRKGDILVLNDRVVVFTGGVLGSPKSYVSLSRSKLLTAKERARVAQMTGPQKADAPAFAEAPAAPLKLRKLRAAELKDRVIPRG